MYTPSTTITANEALSLLQKTIEKSATKRFAVFTDTIAGRIVLEPFDEDDAQPHYELSREGEASLRRALEEEAQRLGKPLSKLKI